MKINSFADLLHILGLQKTNLNTYLTQVNGTAADVTEVTNEYNNLTAIANYADLADGYKKTIVEVKQKLYNGDPLESIPAFPPNITPPALTLPLSGALSRTRDRNARFKAGPGYTTVIGEALGLVESSSIGTDPDVVPPTIDVFPAETLYLFTVVVSNRAGSDAWDLLVRPAGSNSWTVLGYGTGKSKDFTYNPGTAAADDVPIQLSVRVQLKKNDANFGEPSAIVLATVNP